MKDKDIYLDTFLEEKFIPKHIKISNQDGKNYAFIYFGNIFDYSSNPDTMRYIIKYLYDHRIFINSWGLSKLINDSKNKREEVINKFIKETDPHKRIVYRNEIFLLHIKIIKYFAYKYSTIHKLSEEDVYSYLCEKSLGIIDAYNNEEKSDRKKDNSTRFLSFFTISINNALASFPRNGLGITNLVILDALNNSKYLVEKKQSEDIGKRVTIPSDKETIHNFVTYLEKQGTFSDGRECVKRVLPIRFSDSLEEHINDNNNIDYFEKIEDDSLREGIIKILNNFPPEYGKYYAAFTLKYILNVKTYKEIGKMLGVSHEWARIYVFRAIELIKESITNEKNTVVYKKRKWNK